MPHRPDRHRRRGRTGQLGQLGSLHEPGCVQRPAREGVDGCHDAPEQQGRDEHDLRGLRSGVIGRWGGCRPVSAGRRNNEASDALAHSRLKRASGEAVTMGRGTTPRPFCLANAAASPRRRAKGRRLPELDEARETLLDARLALATWIQALIDQRSAYVLEDTQRTAELDQAVRDHQERMISSYSPPLTADRTASSGSGPPTRLSTVAACPSAEAAAPSQASSPRRGHPRRRAP